jgi:hypothetical protein
VPCRYAVLEGGRWVVERWSGDVVAEEIVAHEQDQVADPRIAPGAAGLADLRPARFTGARPYDLSGLVLAHERAGEVALFAKFALVTETSEVFFKSRTLEARMERLGIRVVVFTSLRPACDWLGVDEELVSAALAELARAR